MNLIYFLLAAYFVFNVFFAGWQWGKNWLWTDTNREKWQTVGMLFIAIIAAGVIFIIIGIWELLGLINELFQLRFYLRFYITDFYDKVEEESMIVVNKSVRKYNTSNSLRDRIMRHALGLLNKRHNYKLEEK